VCRSSPDVEVDSDDDMVLDLPTLHKLIGPELRRARARGAPTELKRLSAQYKAAQLRVKEARRKLRAHTQIAAYREFRTMTRRLELKLFRAESKLGARGLMILADSEAAPAPIVSEG
jgi:hypothetical protein